MDNKLIKDAEMVMSKITGYNKLAQIMILSRDGSILHSTFKLEETDAYVDLALKLIETGESLFVATKKTVISASRHSDNRRFQNCYA